MADSRAQRKATGAEDSDECRSVAVSGVSHHVHGHTPARLEEILQRLDESLNRLRLLDRCVIRILKPRSLRLPLSLRLILSVLTLTLLAFRFRFLLRAVPSDVPDLTAGVAFLL